MRVALFASCIVDTLRPEIAFATLRLLEAAGCEVVVPEQSCCGQPNYNNGDEQGARELARLWLDRFEKFDYVVIPSGSCAAMLKEYSAPLFTSEDAEIGRRLTALGQRSYELSQFLIEIIQPTFGDIPMRKICYHDSCSGFRTLGIKEQPRRLLAQIESLELAELDNAEACCGFGGTFCVKHPAISIRLADDKIAAIEASGATTLVGGDWSCLMHLQGRIEAQGKSLDVRHFSELLAEALERS